MKRIIYFILLALLFNCSSDDDSNSNNSENFISITRDGETFSEYNLAYSVFGANNCNDSNVTMDITTQIAFIENSEFSFSLAIAHPTNKSDFDNASLSASQVNIEASDDGIGFIDCVNNFDFITNYNDNSRYVFIDDTVSNINIIENINLINETSTNATYGIRGNYQITYTDGSDYNITITGSYLIHVDTLK
ncbi:hypothetical protein [Psychroserpens burtonensis]|uniref:hypothetical protein n=1 Tax=Psychroserpens burtonensis TaxID=49278 RepID=UPI00040DE4B3|nr:hypothetical protein [Psychroserpens burtonensis]